MYQEADPMVKALSEPLHVAHYAILRTDTFV